MEDLIINQTIPKVWIVGGSSKLGQNIGERLALKYDVTYLSRQKGSSTSINNNRISIDLSDISKAELIIKDSLAEGGPDAVVLCQRYRLPDGVENWEVLQAFNTEIASSQLIIEEIINHANPVPCSIVVVSSINARYVNGSLPLWYHLLKSSQQMLVKYYSIKNGVAHININGIACGSFLKDDVDFYPELLKSHFSNLSRISPMKRNTSIEDISTTVEFLISSAAKMINGQIITIDGGMSNILQETLI